MSLEQAVVDLERRNATLLEEVVRFRDAAMGLNNIHPSVTAGRQNTADGKYFSIPGNGAYMRLYRRNGSSAELIAEFPDRDELNSVIDQLGPLLGRGVVGGSGDLLAQNAFGLGSYGREIGGNNYLDPEISMGAQANGFRAIASSNYPAGLPEELRQAWASVLLNKRTSAVGAGILQSISNDVFFFRVLDEEIVRVYQAITTDNVLGSVSGPSIIEYGSNDDGQYCIFKGGLCMQTVEQVIDLSQQGEQIFRDLPIRMEMPYTVSFDTTVTTGNMHILRATRDLFVTSYGRASLSIRKGTEHFTSRQDSFVFTVWGFTDET